MREAAWQLDKGRCVWPTCRRWLSLAEAHEHEIVWRSKGGDPLDLNNVVTTCAHCHAEIHPRVGGVRKRMAGSRADGIRFWQRHGDDWTEVDGEHRTG